MPRRSSAFEDLIEFASRLQWRVALVLAFVSGGVLHVVATVVSPPKTVPDIGALGTFAPRALWAGVLTALQFVIPAALLVGALVSYCRRSQANKLFGKAHAEGMAVVDKMTWSQFERLVAEAFRRRGYVVSETGGQGPDGGIDVVLARDSERILVQCKQWRTRKVGVSTIRELYGVIAAEGATGGYVVTCGTFTHEAREFARGCRIELLDGDGLEAVVREVDRTNDIGSFTAALAEPIVPATVYPACPACGATMTRRLAKRGRSAGEGFWGCPQYPRCRGTRPLEL